MGVDLIPSLAYARALKFNPNPNPWINGLEKKVGDNGAVVADLWWKLLREFLEGCKVFLRGEHGSVGKFDRWRIFH